MLRKSCLILIAVLMTFVLADVALAQASAWPLEYPTPEADPHAIQRGAGNYFSWIKLGILVALYLLWVRTTEWANKDCQILKLPYPVWNPIIVFPFVAGVLLALTIPVFSAGAGVLSVCYLAPMIAYVIKRNSVVEPQERVMTPAHIRYMFATQLQRMGIDMGLESKAAHEKGSAVAFTPLGGTDQVNQANIIHARQTTGYLSAKDLIADLVRQRADKCMMDFTRDAVSMKFQIDGVWHDSEGQDRESGDLMLAVYKKISNLNVDERRKRQVGKFKAAFESAKYNCMVISQGTQTGERVILQIDRPQSKFSSLEELGMREKTKDALRKMVNAPHGIFLFSSPPSGGLTTTIELALSLTDRYTRDFVAFQDKANPEHLVENIDLTTYDAKAGDVPEKVLETLLRREPNAVVVNELPNVACAILLCDQAATDKLIITTIRAKEAVEALLRVLLLKVPATTFAPAVIGVLNQRLVRRLCDECKQEYEPAPELLKKLGIPKGRIELLYRTPDPNEQDKTCQKCNGIGYFGRIAMFELLAVDSKLRQAIEKQPKLEVLRQVARQAGNRSLQQEGIVLVAQGITSVQELSRVLKQ